MPFDETQQKEIKRDRPSIYRSEKQQKFGTSDNGEFVDNKYRELLQNKMFGRLIGRNYVEPNMKRVFTTSDVVREAYLYKKGSWMKNWKRRYFILRRDIRALCYYISRENLTLLGSISLSANAHIRNVSLSDIDSDGYEWVVSVDNDSSTSTMIRFDTFVEMKAWVIDINHEAQSITERNEGTTDWWSALFDKVSAIESRRHQMRREGLSTRIQSVNSTGPLPPQPTAAFVPRSLSSNPPQQTVIRPLPSDDYSVGSTIPSSSQPFSDTSQHKSLSLETSSPHGVRGIPENSEVDSDGEHNSDVGGIEEVEVKPRSYSESDSLVALPPGQFPAPPNLERSASETEHQPGKRTGSLPMGLHPPTVPSPQGHKSQKIKQMKKDKPPGPPPFQDSTVERFEERPGKLSGLQLSLRLQNACVYQDRIFVVIFGSTNNSGASTYSGAAGQLNQPKERSISTSSSTMITSTFTSSAAAVAALAAAGNGGAPHGSPKTDNSSRWTPLCRTELRTVSEKPKYGENFLEDMKIHFSVIEWLAPGNCKDLKIVVYRQENDIDPREPAKPTNLGMQLEMASAKISRDLFDMKNILKIAMPVKVDSPLDIAIPSFKKTEIMLGIVKLDSTALSRHRVFLRNCWSASPYAEIMYSFGTNRGQTLSIEQLYASRYAVSVAQALTGLWQQEKYDVLEYKLQELRERKKIAVFEQEHSAKPHPSESSDAPGMPEDMLFGPDALQLAIDSVTNLYWESKEYLSLVVSNCNNMARGMMVVNNVVDASKGGAVLRRSVWKKVTNWQYCATNMNVHLMVSSHYNFQEVLMHKEPQDAERHLHYIPTVTMGVPAAHELKYENGGMRKIFQDITCTEQKLKWLHAIQAPRLKNLLVLFQTYEKEAYSLFGSAYLLHSAHDEVVVMRKKLELGRRIDICASQALGCTVTTIRALCTLAAAQPEGRFMDVLGRSLKVGFLVMFQSMLSSMGAELGMIEDLDISALWLSLVTVRLVSRKERVEESSSKSCATEDPTVSESEDSGKLRHKSKKTKSPSKEDVTEDPFSPLKFTTADGSVKAFVGRGEGVRCRRERTGRLVVDIELSPIEVSAVEKALEYMKDFNRLATPSLKSCADAPFAFISDPEVHQFPNHDEFYTIHATAEVLGIAFTQGVNEMQTLANISSSRDVVRQGEINKFALTRLEEYYKNVRCAIEYQLDKKAPEMIDLLNQPNTPTSPLINRLARSNSNTSLQSSSVISSLSPSGPGLLRRNKTRGSIGSSAPLPQLAPQDLVKAQREKALMSYDRLLDELRDVVKVSIESPYDKHVGVLLKSSAFCREIGGIISILCKSGKDRTSMSVTLENTRGIVEDLGVLSGQDICQTMRQQGVRRMNVYANTGQSMYAFNQLQRLALPPCYRPPAGSHAGNVCS